MTPSNPYIVSQLRHLIYYNLDNLHLENALFMAERLHAMDSRNPDSVHLLALCHLQLGQLKQAYDAGRAQALKGCHLGCAYVFAQACRALGVRFDQEGIAVLERARDLWEGRSQNKHSDTSRRHLPDAASVYCLLGKFWHRQGDLQQAVDCYVETLQLNPFMWDAFTALCHFGVDLRPLNIFKLTPEWMALLSSTARAELASHLDPASHSNHLDLPLPADDPFGELSSGPLVAGGGGLFRRLRVNVDAAPSSNVAPGAGELPAPIGPSGADGIDGPNTGVEGEGGAFAVPAASGAPASAPTMPTRSIPASGSEPAVDAATRPRPITTRAKTRVEQAVEEAAEASAAARPAFSTTLVHDRKRTVTGQTVPSAPSQAPTDPTAAPQRRSVRLFNQIRPASSRLAAAAAGGSLGFREGREMKKTRAPANRARMAATASTVGRVVSGNRKPTEAMDVDVKEPGPATAASTATTGPGATTTAAAAAATSLASELAGQREGLLSLLTLFRYLGTGYYELSRFRCREAVENFDKLPASQRETAWVLGQLGRAYYEQTAYAQAGRYFKKLRALAPSRLEDMEIYSTVLWHLKNEIELSFLAHELMDLDRLSPQAWCALGNSFALQRDHDLALRSFYRAVQIDPYFVYAWTLQGHEHMANEEYDRAKRAYQASIAVDRRHYNAWYGLGNVYEKHGALDLAEKHFRIAIRINPTNSVLLCCLGTTLEKLRNLREALVQYTEACELAPRSLMPRYKKARLLIEVREPHAALDELLVCKDVAPDEANVHYWLGRVYKLLHDKANAIKHLTIAMNLDPKAGPTIRMDIESLDDDVDMDAVL
ncbi:MAG: anaphase-promoting complex subunit cdc27 [Phylliscum demangeonii]|nr:MAG: anaphase-promoting complex subunit cdc27 [Phylliscum demangeonii]